MPTGNESDYEEINITVSLIEDKDYQKLKVNFYPFVFYWITKRYEIQFD